MSEEFIWVLIVNIASSLILTGIVWFLQLAWYPVLSRLHRAEFTYHHRRLISRAALVISPIMVAELASSVWLVMQAETLYFYHLAGLITVIMLWLSTLLLHLPLHFKLQRGYDEEFVKRLSDVNWLRIILWSVKSLISLQVLLHLIG